MNSKIKPGYTRKIRAILLILVAMLLIFLAIAYIKDYWNEIAQIRIVDPSIFFVLIFLFLVNQFLIGVVNKWILDSLGLNMKHGESFMLSVATNFYSLITPLRGGMATRAIYLKRKYKLDYTNFAILFSTTYIISFFIAATLGIISILILYLKTKMISWILFFIFSAVFVGCSGIIIKSPKLKECSYSWINQFINVVNGWYYIRGNKRVIHLIGFIGIIQTAVMAFMFLLEFHVFGIKIGLWEGIFLSSILNLGLLISITPAGLGIQEAITVFSAATIGISPAQSLSVALLGRVVSLVVLFILGPIFSYILLKHDPKKNERQN